MTTLDIAGQRLYHQRLRQGTFSNPADVVRWFGAVQAQELPGALYAIGLRMKSVATEALVEQAIADRTIVRSWPMRGTLHFMAAEDARWMINLLAPRLDAKVANNYRKAGLSLTALTRAGEILRQELHGGKQRTRPELYEALNDAGIETNVHNGEPRGAHILGFWARKALICIAARRGKQWPFALLDEWLPPGRELAGNQALAEIAKRYFTSHGPATIKDFAWWSGLTITEARRGLQQVDQSFDHETVDGQEYWFTPGETPNRSEAPHVLLLPAYDEYTVAYADRSAAIDPALLRQAGYGIGPNIIIDGRIVGTWKHKAKDDSVIISTNLLRPLDRIEEASLGEAAAKYGEFLGATATFA